MAFLSDPYVSFLKSATGITLEFVITAEGFCVAEIFQATRDRRVLFYVNAQVKEILILGCDGFAIEASRFARKYALENVADPRGFLALLLGLIRSQLRLSRAHLTPFS